MVENRSAGQGIVEALAGKRILLTGVTGFLGQVVLERILLDFPELRVTVLVRGQQFSTAHDRVVYLLRKPAFTVLRERHGAEGLEALLDQQVTVLEGDFTRGEPDIPEGIDVVIHSAAAVSFDPPIDEGFQTNLLGARNLYRSRPSLHHAQRVQIGAAVIPSSSRHIRGQYGGPPRPGFSRRVPLSRI